MGGDLPPRGSFATLTDADVARFRSILESTPGDVARAVLTDEKSLADANEDWTRAYRGRSRVLLLPRTTSQVAAIVRHCNDRNLAVVPQGGNTGLVGGGVPVHDEVVLGVKRMRSVVSIDPSAGVVVAEAGVVLDDLETALNREGMTVPLDLGAKGKCQIGGNVSTNAGGLRLLRHGSLHGSVLGVEVVLASGEVLNLLKTLRKDNTGYDLKQLFIGAEGTLGVVTKVALLAPRKPRRVDVTFAAAPSFSGAFCLSSIVVHRSPYDPVRVVNADP
jgi:D-2-hydroxyglutarate dehydrogenase